MKLIAFLNSDMNQHINHLNSSGFPSLIDSFSAGYANGYVMIPKEHPYYGKSYYEIDGIDVHGGLTFSDFILDNWNAEEWLDEKPEHPEDYWVLGFDTIHAGDNLTNWDRDAVINETLRLKEQLENVVNG